MSDQPSPTSEHFVRRPTVDELGEASFPASDPPQAWTWEPHAHRLPAPAETERRGHPTDPRMPA